MCGWVREAGTGCCLCATAQWVGCPPTAWESPFAALGEPHKPWFFLPSLWVSPQAPILRSTGYMEPVFHSPSQKVVACREVVRYSCDVTSTLQQINGFLILVMLRQIKWEKDFSDLQDVLYSVRAQKTCPVLSLHLLTSNKPSTTFSTSHLRRVWFFF